MPVFILPRPLQDIIGIQFGKVDFALVLELRLRNGTGCFHKKQWLDVG